MRITIAIILILGITTNYAFSEQKVAVKVGIATVLTGDAAVIGSNIEKTIAAYQKRYLRHPVKFIYEDAKISSADGLAAYRKLIEIDRVDMLIGGTTSNGTIAGAPLVNRSKTVLITPLTGGANIDKSGPYIFRIGNSDILNGYQQADLLLSEGLRNVAIVTEQTEYTAEIARFFKERLLQRGGTIVSDDEFLPSSTDFRTVITRIKSKRPQALVMSTQTGLAFGLFVKQLKEIAGNELIQIHTNFLAADNPDARAAAGEAINGVRYMAPAYDRANPRLLRFLKEFKEDHGAEPAITFHTAGTVDSLDMLQAYLDQNPVFDREGFHDYLIAKIKNYNGLMGNYSFNAEGNADIGFEPQVITR